ncbi:hypothetical protein BC826DRAFT_1175418 [Russula brevipes]|nr:hypothetical protein BC826DRAFT_1175418 [Russula brevipes]
MSSYPARPTQVRLIMSVRVRGRGSLEARSRTLNWFAAAAPLNLRFAVHIEKRGESRSANCLVVGRHHRSSAHPMIGCPDTGGEPGAPTPRHWPISSFPALLYFRYRVRDGTPVPLLPSPNPKAGADLPIEPIEVHAPRLELVSDTSACTHVQYDRTHACDWRNPPLHFENFVGPQEPGKTPVAQDKPGSPTFGGEQAAVLSGLQTRHQDQLRNPKLHASSVALPKDGTAIKVPAPSWRDGSTSLVPKRTASAGAA